MKELKEIQDKAENYFNSGYNCCESVVLAVCDYLGKDKELPLKIATPFGSGMSRNGSNCGALNAAFICMGMEKGRKSNEDGRDASYLPADRIFNKFKEKYGSSCCYDITGINMKNPEELARKKEWMHKELCGPLVRQVTEWVLAELDKK
ncbi:MAG: C-GCAxxG-C-C family protein [Caulobacteraceae bacterium]